MLGACRPNATVAVHQEQVPVRVDTDWYPEAEHGGFYEALGLGYYRDAGLDVTITPGGPNTHPIVELAVGHAQFAIAASDDVIEQAAQGLPFLIVGAFMERYPEAILVHDSSPIHSFPDLNGRSIIGVPGTGWISYVEQKYGIKIFVSPIDFELARFIGDDGAIQQVYLTNEPYFVKKAGIKARTMKISETGYDPYRVIITTVGFASAHPDVVRAFVAASTKGWAQFIGGDPSAARSLILARNPQIKPDFFDDTLRVLKENHLVDGEASRGERVGALSLGRLQEQIDTLARIKFIKATFPVSRIATLEFLPQELKGAN